MGNKHSQPGVKQKVIFKKKKIKKVLQAGGNSYHTSCLKCYICTQQFEEGQEIFMQDELFWHTDCDETTHPAATEEKVAPLPEIAPLDLTLALPASGSPPAGSTTITPFEPGSLETQILSEMAGNDQLTVDHTRDRTKSDVSILSDYEDLSVPQEMNRDTVYDSDFENEVRRPGKSPELRHPSEEPTVAVASTRPISEITAPRSVSTPSNSVSTPIQSTPPTPKSGSTAPKSEWSTYSESSMEPLATNIESDKSDVFTDETVVVNENGKNSASSEPAEEEKPLSVKELLRLAKEKERQVLGASPVVPPAKTTNNLSVANSKRYRSTESDNSDRGSEASDPPAKPPRSRSPFIGSVTESSGKKVSTSSETTERSLSPNTGLSVRGLRNVDSPVILDDGANRGDEEQIDYLDFQDTYDLVILQTQKMRLPHGIDKSQLQHYLTPDQFESAFKMSSDKFDTLPLWRKTNLKKSLKLF